MELGNRMRLNEKYAPIMYRAGFLRAPVERVVKTFIHWRNWILEQVPWDEKVNVTQVGGNFKETLAHLFPLISDCDRFLFVPTKSDWTLYLNNTFVGSDSVGVEPLVKRLGSPGIYMIAEPHTSERDGKNWKGSQCARILEFFESPDGETVKTRRSIWLEYYYGKWTFELLGDPFPFEDLTAYQKRRKKDRFTIEMMERYLGEFGIRPFDEDFYDPENASLVVLSGTNRGERGQNFASYEEVRKHLRIDHLYEDSD